MKRNRYSWLKLAGNKFKCVTCGLIKDYVSNPNGYGAIAKYYYQEMNNIEYDKMPECKDLNN